jgi:sugar phosphate isomerase/epimerase
MKRRETLKAIGLAAGTTVLPQLASAESRETKDQKKTAGQFKYCLNTSTIRGQKLGLTKMIETAAKAGFDSLELWVMDVKAYKEQGASMPALKKLIDDSKLTVEDAIGFAPWMVDDEAQRTAGFIQMKEEMLLMAEIGCKRIAAPSSGVKPDAQLDFYKVGERYKKLIDLGRETGVKPLLEFWGGSPVFYHFGQALMACAAANDPDVNILPDVYHLFRGGSNFDCLKMVNGRMIDVIHINDYPGNVARTEQNDSHRVYPGDGVAPFKQIMTDLANMGGTKVLSLEVFNKDYWAQDPLTVCKTGLEKMKKVVELAK